VKLSRNWLQSYVSLDGRTDDEIARAVTFLGFEVEGIQRTGAPRLETVFVGEVLTREKHPNADKLSVCTVDVGPVHGVKTIVCGAQNYKVGDRVPVALAGAVLPGNFVIRQSKIRGSLSDGMMCSGKELGVGDDHAGLLILEDRPALGLPINEVLPAGDVVFDVEITPNRPDCLCHLGMARELAAWFRQELRYPELDAERIAGGPARPDLLADVTVEVPEDCPLYLARVVTGVKVGPSPAWLQERLRAIGLRPINNIVDVGNFLLHEYGQPLHTFDARRLGGARIVVRRARDGERLVTLDGKERVLTPSMLVIADAEKPVVIAGIMGGENSGVSESTTDVVLEAACFRRQSIRATSKRLGLASDSSYRFERGVDPHTLPEAARRALQLILETAGGQVAGEFVTVGGDVPWQREIAVSPAFIAERLGFAIPPGDMRASLEALELAVVREREGETAADTEWTVGIPSWRDDLDRPIDLVEEVLRLYGTDRIPVSPVLAPGLAADDDPAIGFTRRAVDYLVGHDFHECLNYTLRPQSEVAAGAPASLTAALALANPFVEDQSHLRTSLVGGLLETVRLNQSRGVRVARVAEAGRIFRERDGQLIECLAIAFLLVEDKGERAWRPREPADVFTAKHHCAVLASFAGATIASRAQPVAADGSPEWQPGQAGAATDARAGLAATFGLLNLARVRAAGIEGKVFAGEVVVLPERLGEVERRRYRPFSLYPAALRDLAVVVPETAAAEDVRRAIEQAASGAAGKAFALEAVQLFDLYRGEGLPEGHKSLAFSLVFRSGERTLTDEEVNAAFLAAQTTLADSGYSIRK
jgi:phenylalanyl-tRNA synthetase beta chain